MFLEIATHAAVTGAFEAYEHRNDLSLWWDRFTYILKHKKLAVLIVGSGGVGKSTLSKFLCSPSVKVPPEAYKESMLVERLSLPGGAVADLVAAPGQRRHIERWEDLFDEVKKRGKTFGVINVVSYGYHATPLSMSELRGKEDSVPVPFPRYLGDCRQLELELLREVAKLLRRHTKPFWMITLVSKQDLWWPERKNVERHYCGGEYSQVIEEIRKSHHATGFQHEFFSAAVHSQNFYQEDGKLLQPTAAGYDDVIKYSHQKMLLEVVEKMIDPRKT